MRKWHVWCCVSKAVRRFQTEFRCREGKEKILMTTQRGAYCSKPLSHPFLINTSGPLEGVQIKGFKRNWSNWLHSAWQGIFFFLSFFQSMLLFTAQNCSRITTPSPHCLQRTALHAFLALFSRASCFGATLHGQRRLSESIVQPNKPNPPD